MKGGSVFKKIIYSSVFLAAVPAILIMFFLPPLGTKFRLQVEPVDKNSSINVYADLNSDTISEVIRSGKGVPYFNILILDNNMRVYDQWNLQDSMDLDMSDFFFGNYDHDRYKEIYVFTYKDDSLFLNINEFFDPSGTKLDRIYLTKIRVVNKKVTSMIWPAGFFDTNGDGKDELFFSIQTGFGVEPRRLYSFDIAHRELKTSQLTGVICQFPRMVDSDGDGRPEIFGLMGASGNSKTWFPFSDWSTWLMVFNDSLKLKFPPVEFPGLTNILEINSYTKDGFKGYVVSHNTGSADTNVIKPRIMFYSLDGKKIRERLFSEFGFNTITENNIVKLTLWRGNNNIIAKCNISNIFLTGWSGSNLFTKNNFFYDTSTDEYSVIVNSANRWDNDSVGNYWSDYPAKYLNASEVDNIGIGNAPYVLDQSNIDRYPLLCPYNIEKDQITLPASIQKPENEVSLIPLIMGILTILVIVVAIWTYYLVYNSQKSITIPMESYHLIDLLFSNISELCNSSLMLKTHDDPLT